MLTQLRFSNFKSWAGTNHVDFGRITGLFGPNSSGKTTILQTLLLLKQTSETRDYNLALNFGGNPGEYVNFGSYVDIIHQRDQTRKLSLGMTWTDPNRAPPAPRYRPAPREMSLDVEFSAGMSRSQERVRVERLKYVVGEFESSTVGYELPKGELEIEVARPSARAKGCQVSMRWGDTIKIGLPSRLRYTPFGPFGIPYTAFQDLQATRRGSRAQSVPTHSRRRDPMDFLYVLNPFRIEELLRSVCYLGPLRDYPRRNYQWTGTLPATVGQRGEWTVQILLASRARNSRTQDQPKIAEVEEWLRKLGIAESFSLRKVGRGARLWELMVRPPNVVAYEANLADVGFGVSQILPVIVALLDAPEGSTVLLEQPEIHLHPRVQMDLVDFFIFVAKQRDIQIVFESHSEYMLARLQRRVAESNGYDTPIGTDDVKLYFCSLEGDHSVLHPLKVNPNGSIQNWPPDFFGDTFAERMAIAKASVGAGS